MTDQNLPSDDAVNSLFSTYRARYEARIVISRYLEETDEGRALVRDAGRYRHIASNTMPICECAVVWPGQGHPPDCPVRREIESLRAQLAEAQRERDAAIADRGWREVTDWNHLAQWCHRCGKQAYGPASIHTCRPHPVIESLRAQLAEAQRERDAAIADRDAQAELFDCDREAAFAAARVLLPALGWGSGGLHQAACEIVEQRDKLREFVASLNTWMFESGKDYNKAFAGCSWCAGDESKCEDWCAIRKKRAAVGD